MSDVLGSGANHGATEKQQLRAALQQQRAELNNLRALVCVLVRRGVQGARPDQWATSIPASEFGALNGASWHVDMAPDPETGAAVVTVTGTPAERPQHVAH